MSWYERLAFPGKWLCQPRVVLRILGVVTEPHSGSVAEGRAKIPTAGSGTAEAAEAVDGAPAEQASAEGDKPGRVTVTAAPEPDEVLWTNLEVSDRDLAKRTLQAYAAILALVTVTLTCVMTLRLVMANVVLDMSDAIRSQSNTAFAALVARGTTLGLTALVATYARFRARTQASMRDFVDPVVPRVWRRATVIINMVNRIVITGIIKKGGIDTVRTHGLRPSTSRLRHRSHHVPLAPLRTDHRAGACPLRSRLDRIRP